MYQGYIYVHAGHLGIDERTSPTAQPGKDWASCLPYHSNSTTWFYHPDRLSKNYPIKLSQKSWGNFRWPAHFQKPHCKNRSILQVCIAQHQKDQALPYTAHCTTHVQALVIFRLDYCNTILAGLPSCTIKPLQMIQYAAARLVFSKPKRAHVTPLSPCTGSRLQLASSSRHWCLHIEQPQAQHPPTSTHWWQSTFLPEAWDLRVSDASWCHHREAQNHFPEHFYSPFLAGRMNFPPHPECWVPDNFQATPENSSHPSSHDFCFFFIKQKHLCSLSLTSPIFCSEGCLKCCITSTSCDCLPLYNVSLIVFPNCKSLWIKVSAKGINVNVHLG